MPTQLNAPTLSAEERSAIERFVRGVAVSGFNTVDTRAELAGLPTATPAYLSESGREGLFVWDSSDLSAKVTADTTQGIYIAPATDATGASGAWVRKFDGLASAAWWGLVYDDATDNYAALQAAINVSKAAQLTGASYGYGRGSFGLFIPFKASGKALYCSQKLIVEHAMRIVWDSGHGARGQGAVLRFPLGQGGILLKDDVVTGGAAGAVLDNPALHGSWAGGAEAELHGIEFQVTCRINNAFVISFQGDGIYADTNGNGYNVNGFVIDNPFVQGCRNGIFLKGADTNAGTLINPQATSNRRYGCWSTLTLGNTYIGGNFSTNGTQGVGGVIPYTMASFGGQRYYVLPDQDVAASTTAPSGTTANNAVWGWWGTGGAATEFPAWVTGTQTFRAGGAARFEGAFEQNACIELYCEPDQAPIQMVDGPQTLFFGSLQGRVVLPDGSDYGGAIYGNTAGIDIVGGFSAASGGVEGDFSLTRATGDYAPSLIINGTGAGTGSYIKFRTNGVERAVVYADEAGNLWLQPTGSGEVRLFGPTGMTAEVDDASINLLSGKVLKVNGTQVIAAQGAAVADATDAASAITQLNALLARCRTHGLIA